MLVDDGPEYAAAKILLRRYAIALKIMKTTRLPREINEQFLETARQEFVIPCSLAACHLVDHQACECMNGRVYITQGELISWQLAVRGHVPLS